MTKATLIKRYKRFLADVQMPDGEIITVHCPNPGSMLGINEAGMKVLLAKSPNPKRKLLWTLQFVDVGSSLVLVESALANKLFLEAFTGSIIESLSHYTEARAEHSFHDSRLDFLLSGSLGHCLVEVKSTTYLDQGVALFPDAQTERGRKHLRTLEHGLMNGYDALQFFVVARSDAELFKPAAAIDPAYAQALKAASAKGVRVMAHALKFDSKPGSDEHLIDLEITVDKAVTINLD